MQIITQDVRLMLLIGQSETMLSFRESCPCQSKKHKSILYENVKQGKQYNETVFLCCGYTFDGQKVGEKKTPEKKNKKTQLHCVGPFVSFCTSEKCSHH